MTMLSFLVLAAEEAEAEPVAFYVAGGLLAAWAVVLAVIGLTRPEFPGEGGAAKGVAGISIVLVAAAALSAVLSG